MTIKNTFAFLKAILVASLMLGVLIITVYVSYILIPLIILTVLTAGAYLIFSKE